jgi:hypothetical protein
MQMPERSVPLIGLCVLLGTVFIFNFLSGQERAAEASDLSHYWDKKLPSASRFTPLSDFGGAAVRDEETGLVWETTLETSEMSWTDARSACADKEIGGRKGWRLPSVSELSSLVDPSIKTRPTLPLGHPFTNVQDVYWSATTVTDNAKNAWLVFFDTGKVIYAFKTITFHIWCVRNGTSADQY